MPRYDVPKYAPANDYSEPEYALSHPKTIILINRLVNLVKLTELLKVSVFWTLVNMYRCYKLKKKL